MFNFQIHESIEDIPRVLAERKVVYEVSTFPSVNEGLLAVNPFSMRRNLDTRVSYPMLKDGKDLWDFWLNSGAFYLGGYQNECGRYCFKIDHEFSFLESEFNGNLVKIDKAAYEGSEGVEFIIIPKAGVPRAQCDYVLKFERYHAVSKGLAKKTLDAEKLERKGACKVNYLLSPMEVSAHDIWNDLSCSDNEQSFFRRRRSKRFLEEQYIPEAVKRGCFQNSGGMGIVLLPQDEYVARPIYLLTAEHRSSVQMSLDFNVEGNFLRVAGNNNHDMTASDALDYICHNPNKAIESLNHHPHFRHKLMEIMADSMKDSMDENGLDQ